MGCTIVPALHTMWFPQKLYCSLIHMNLSLDLKVWVTTIEEILKAEKAKTTPVQAALQQCYKENNKLDKATLQQVEKNLRNVRNAAIKMQRGRSRKVGTQNNRILFVYKIFIHLWIVYSSFPSSIHSILPSLLLS